MQAVINLGTYLFVLHKSRHEALSASKINYFISKTFTARLVFALLILNQR